MSMQDALPNGQGIPTRANTGVMPRFKVENVSTGQIDPETGLPQYRQMEMVELHIPGDVKSVPSHRVNDAIRKQYAPEYEAWKRSGKQVSDLAGVGLPLVHWPQLPAQIAASLAHANVFTVEHLAGLSDTQCQINGAIGIRKWRDMAAAFVEKSSAAAPIANLTREVEALKAAMALKDKQIEQVNARAEEAERKANGTPDVPDLSAPTETKRGPGRPRKDAEA
jgi:hypothetical protein